MRRSSLTSIAVTLGASLLAGIASAAPASTTVEDFALLDQDGKFHHLYYLSDAKAVVLMTHDNDCPATGQSVTALEQAKSSFGSRG